MKRSKRSIGIRREYQRDIKAKINTFKCRDEAYDYFKYMCEKILDFPKDTAYRYAVENEIINFIDKETEKRIKEMEEENV